MAHSPETRRKISAALKGRPTVWLGRRHRADAIDKMREFQRARVDVQGYINPFAGKKHSEAARMKMRAAHRGKKKPWAAETGRCDAVREKNRLAHLGRTVSPAARARMSIGQRAIPKTPEWNAKNADWHRGRRLSAAAMEKIRAAVLDGRISPRNQAGLRYEYLDVKGRLWRFRSSWELRVAEQFDREALTWAYEPCRLLLSNGRVYIPDFWVEEWSTYVEVKGWKRPGSIDKVGAALADGHAVLLVDDLATWLAAR